MTYQGKIRYTIYTKLRFSMLEIVISLVIASMGIATVTAMYTTGMDMNRGSISEITALDTADQFLKYNANKIHGNWQWLNIFASDKPGASEPDLDHDWAEQSIFTIGDVTIRPDNSMNILDNNNSGFFLVEKTSPAGGSDSEMIAVIRLWKEVEGNRDCSKTAKLFCEISWSALVPYTSTERKKVVVQREVFKAPFVGVVSTSGLRRDNGSAYETTLRDIQENEDETFTVSLTISHECFCEPTSSYQNKFFVGADGADISDISIDGTVAVVEEYLDLSNPYHGGFGITEIPVGKDMNVPGAFTVTYTISELEDQHISVYDDDNDIHHVAEFTETDLINYIEGTWSNDENVVVADSH